MNHPVYFGIGSDDGRGEAVSVRSVVIEQFIQVAREQGKTVPVLSDDLALVDSEFDSLCFAIIVARLEDSLGIDPFNTSGELAFPATLGEFIGLYDGTAR